MIGCQEQVVIPSQLSQDKGLERPVPPVQAPTKKRVALAIGNANYDFAPLKKPVNDARDMAKALRSVGFDVIKKENASWDDMDKDITAFKKKLDKGVVGLFYFVASASDTPPVVPTPVNTGENAEIARLRKQAAEAEARAERERLARIKANQRKKVFRDTLRDGSQGPEMVRIPAGSFRMGDIQGGGADDEKPVHWVSVSAFAMGKYEVTFAEYDKFAQATGKKKPSDEGWGRGNRPVINVSLNDAIAYTKWLSQQTRQSYRLPAEAEWEYAARAGTETKYWWGNTASHEYMNYGIDECCDGLAKGKDRWKYTSPVGSFAANKFGLYDMAGNLREWTCSEYHKKYQGDEEVCKKNASLFVLRGGSWYNDPWWARSAFRIWNWPSNRTGNNGFRLVRTP